MTIRPHDVADLHLAPVVLALDARIVELGLLDPEALARRVALEGDTPDVTRDLRSAGLLRSIRYFIDCHAWELSWDVRGLRLTHGKNRVVLGVPASFEAYVSGPRLTTAAGV
jgi:hypothetical protein